MSPLFGAAERAVLAYTDRLILQKGRRPDGVFEALKAVLSPGQIVELGYTIMAYGLNASLFRSLRLEYEDVPDRIREAPIPPGGGLATGWSAE